MIFQVTQLRSYGSKGPMILKKGGYFQESKGGYCRSCGKEKNYAITI